MGFRLGSCLIDALPMAHRRPEGGEPEMLGLGAYAQAAWHAYNLALAAHPIFTKCMTSLTCFILSDTVAQLPSGKVPYPARWPLMSHLACTACLQQGWHADSKAWQLSKPRACAV